MSQFSITKLTLYVSFLLLVTGLSSSNLRQDFLKLKDKILKMYKVNGKTFTCLYLKECCRLIAKNSAGEPTRSSQEPRVAICRGVPLIVPGPLRLLIEVRDPRIMRVVLTILSTYRSVIIPSKLKLETITSPSSGIVSTLPEVASIMENFKTLFVKEKTLFLKRKSLILPMVRLLNLSSSGPNCKIQILGYPIDALAWKDNPLLESFKVVSEYLGKDIYKTLIQEIDLSFKDSSLLERLDEFRKKGPICLGRLAFKQEAAGKVRVFAIADA